MQRTPPLRRLLTAPLLLLTALLPASPLLASPPPEFEQERRAFIQEMAQKHGFDQDLLQRTVGQAVYQQRIIDAITRPAEARPWRDYRPIFLTKNRIDGGAAFWRKHAEILARAERTYGVPAEIIVAIIGVETNYGGNTGSWRVVDALATLGFAYPRRADFFRKELESFLLLTQEEEIDPLTVRGSYAGAIGLPQFIPSSYRAYSVDFSGDGQRNLLTSVEDAIGSVAAYLHRHNWQRGGSITSRASGAGEQHQSFVDAGMKPSFTLAELERAGIRPVDSEVITSLSSLIRLEGADGVEYWLGFDNFYAITRYNRSNLYAMAVVQLSEEIRRSYATRPAFDLSRATP